jgi:hypothetical protein
LIQLYQSGGAGDFTILQDALSQEETRTLIENTARLLRARGEIPAAQILSTVPFRLVGATNHFNDEFSMLYAVVPLAEYEHLRQDFQDPAGRQAFRQIAMVISEIGPPVRFIAAELALERPVHPAARSEHALKQTEINKLVYKYIGVSQGYLGDFSYGSHHEFYIELDLAINPYEYDGTTRERFIKILRESPPAVQAKILEGILRRYPIGSSELRTQDRYAEIRRWISRLRGAPVVEPPALRITSEVVERALLDAQELIRATGATSSVDRIHTALHGYLRALCQGAVFHVTEDASLPELFKQIRERHPAFKDLGPRAEDILRVLRALGAILDTLSPLRNKASVAHPNPTLLSEPEAMLVVNSVRTILHYLDEKVHRHTARDT